MTNMNMSPAQFGSSSWNPFSSLSNKMGRGSGGGISGAVVQHGLNKDLATHVGNIEHNLETLKGQNATTLAQTENEGRLKEQRASQRHERRQATLTHNQELARLAVVHHNSVGQVRAESAARIAEGAATQGNASSFVEQIHSHAEPGTDVKLAHGNINASFTVKKKAAPVKKAAEETSASTEETVKSKKLVRQNKKTGKLESYEVR